MNILGFFPNLALVEYHTKWICIEWGPGLCTLLKVSKSHLLRIVSFVRFFGRIEDTINCFWGLLTFSGCHVKNRVLQRRLNFGRSTFLLNLPQFLLLLIAKRISSAVIKITKIAYKSFALITRIYELRSVLNFVNLKCQVAEICSMRTYYSCVGTTMMLQCRQWNLYIHLLFHRIKLLDNKYLAQRIQRPIIKLWIQVFLSNYNNFYMSCLIISSIFLLVVNPWLWRLLEAKNVIQWPA